MDHMREVLRGGSKEVSLYSADPSPGDLFIVTELLPVFALDCPDLRTEIERHDLRGVPAGSLLVVTGPVVRHVIDYHRSATCTQEMTPVVTHMGAFHAQTNLLLLCTEPV